MSSVFEEYLSGKRVSRPKKVCTEIFDGMTARAALDVLDQMMTQALHETFGSDPVTIDKISMARKTAKRRWLADMFKIIGHGATSSIDEALGLALRR